MGIWQRLLGKTEAAPVDVFRIDDEGRVKETTIERLILHEKAREEHERAVTVMDRGEYRTAIGMFENVLRTTADDPEPMTYLNIAVCHAHLGDFGQALSILENAMRRWPTNARLRQNYEAIKRETR